MTINPKPPEEPLKVNKWVMPVIWLLFSVLLIWSTTSAWSSDDQTIIHIPYSTLLAQIRADNVGEINLLGDGLTGTFIKPVRWSPPNESTGEDVVPVTADSFRSTFPAAIGDTNFLPLLEAHDVEVNVTRPVSSWSIALLIQGLPFLLLIGFFIWMGRRAMSSQSNVFSFGQTQARRIISEEAKITFNDVAGADEAKLELQEVVDFLRHPAKYHEIGARIPRGTLLVGPPGTGKTLLARAIAGEADVPFFNLSASEFVEMFVGVGASRVRDLFKQAKEAAPTIIFIDELDAVGRRRGAGMGTVNDEREQTLNQMLAEMDGFDERQEVIVLAATNRPDVLDPALLRPGRFDRQVTVSLPDRRGREGILRIHTRGILLTPDVNLDMLAGVTTGMSGADLANLCNEAALIAARHNQKQVTMENFGEAQDKVLLGGIRPLVLNDHERRVIAYHEAGHVLTAWLIPAADPVYKATIIPRGRALGVTEQVPDEDRYNYSRTYMLARLAVLLGGRTAEEIIIGDITTGAENDLVEATRLARQMITRWGMSKLGLATFTADGEHPFLGYRMAQGPDYSEDTAAKIDQNVQAVLEDRHELVHCLLAYEREKLDQLAQALLAQETINREDIEQLLGPRPKANDEALPETLAA